MHFHNSIESRRMTTDHRGWPRITRMVAVAVVVVLAGFGCEPAGQTPYVNQPTDTTPTDNAGGDAGTTGTTGTAWATYTSPTLGISIPYPEGWVVEAEDGGGVSFHESARPTTESEYPAEMWADSFSGSIDEFLAQFRSGDVLEKSEVNRSGKTMQRVALRHDLFGTAVSYIWEEGGMTRRIGGRADSTLEYAVDHLGVSP